MTPLFSFLAAILCLWMVLCLVCGYRRRVLLFLGVLLTGLSMNQLWMYLGLQARPTEINAIIAQVAVVFYGISAFGTGWLVGRISRAWAESRIED
jgi:hypothetical protein